ncbi:MAG: hypothetical protein VSS75_030090 [Candidatus Parabeggiatoa sp.]|nr:hypothetical protein [Candidatus Parabeggiatoa sp.]
METLKQSALTAISQLPDTVNINDIVVVLHQMKTEKKVQNQTATDTQAVSCLELMKDYIGCVKDAPKDLSTNKTYFEGFGS